MNPPEYFEAVRAVAATQHVQLGLAPGVSAVRLAEAEGELGFPMDEGLRQAWLDHDGSDCWQSVFANPGFHTGYAFMSLTEAMEQRAAMQRVAPAYAGYVQPEPWDPRIRQGWFEEGWLPFAAFGGSTLLLIVDHSPAPSGTRGQIIAFTHDPDAITFVASSWQELLPRSLAALQADPEDFFFEE